MILLGFMNSTHTHTHTNNSISLTGAREMLVSDVWNYLMIRDGKHGLKGEKKMWEKSRRGEKAEGERHSLIWWKIAHRWRLLIPIEWNSFLQVAAAVLHFFWQCSTLFHSAGAAAQLAPSTAVEMWHGVFISNLSDGESQCFISKGMFDKYWSRVPFSQRNTIRWIHWESAILQWSP